MGTLQLVDLRDEVLRHMGNRDDITNARANRVINLMQERMARAHDFEELQIASTGTFTFTGTISADRFVTISDLSTSAIKEIYSFRLPTDDGRGRKLIQYTPRMFDELVSDPQFNDVDMPTHYIQWADKFELWRIPDQAYPYEIRLIKWPATLATDGAISDLDHKDDLLILASVSWFFNSLGEYERGGRFFGIFQKLWEDAVREDINKPDRTLTNPRYQTAQPLSSSYWLDPFVSSVDGGL